MPRHLTTSRFALVPGDHAFRRIRRREPAHAGERGRGFYPLPAIFPALAANVSIYGLVADPAAIQRLIDALQGTFPSAAPGLLHGELDTLIKNGPCGLSVGVAIGRGTTLWS